MGKESIPAIRSGPKHLSHGLNSVEPQRGSGKHLTHLQLESAKIEWQVANTPFAIIKNTRK